MSSPTRPNRLKAETSPYLLQHAHNPVDWYPWGDEALRRARREDKPIFLSIGYAACHWCHVMERESFEDTATAQVMNEHFVNIKVDREERQDLDQIYMTAVQAMTQHGGWPMSVFLTPDLEPFYGGTYFPNTDRMGMPSFKKVLLGVANAWKTKPDDLRRSARELVNALNDMNRQSAAPAGTTLSLALIDTAAAAHHRAFDSIHGGFGGAPKFFHTMGLKACLRHWERTKDTTSLNVVTFSLDQMLRGGIYDQLGGGFHRYSTDAEWLAPHFEKMLYDNALLADLYLEGYQATRKPEYAQTARETLDYVLREMTSPEGGFYSTQDADSEGVEGKFYVWTKGEIEKELDAEMAPQFSYLYDVSEHGNWEGHTILRRSHSLDEVAAKFGADRPWLEDSMAAAKRKLLTVRNRRIAPMRDEKILVGWNGLMIEAMARGHQRLGDDRYLAAARSAARFIWEKMVLREPERGLRLLHAHKDGKSRFNGYLDDYAYFISALLALYESDFDVTWIQWAREVADVLLAQFWDRATPGFYYTAADHEKLILRAKDTHDGAMPSGMSMAITALIRLGRLTGQTEYTKRAEEALLSHAAAMHQMPTAMAQFHVAVDLLLNRPQEVVIAGTLGEEETEAALQLMRDRYLPNTLLALVPPDADVKAIETALPSLKGKGARDGKTTLYLCEGMTCQAPVTTAQELAALLDAGRTSKP